MNLRYCYILFALLLHLSSFSQNKDRIKEFELALSKAKHDSTRIKYFNELSWEWSSYNFNLSKSYANKALELALKTNDTKAMASSYNNLASVFDYSGYFDSSFVYYAKALKIRKNGGDKNGEANILNNIGISFYFQGNFNEALKYYMKAAGIREQLKDTLGYAQSLNNIGIIYRNTGDLKNAIDTYKKSLQVKTALKDDDGIYMSCTNLIVAFQGIKEYDSAFYYANKALKIGQQKKESTYIAAILGNKASIYKDLAQYDKSIEQLNEALEMYKNTDNQQDEVLMISMLADVYFLKKDFDKALSHYEKGLEMSRQLQRTEITLTYLLNISNTYTSLKKFEKALTFQTEYIALKDSMNNAENKKQLNQLKTKFETEIREKEIVQAKTAQNLSSLQLEKNAKDLRNLVILAITLLVLIGIVLYFFLQKRKANKKISEQSRKIEIALAEKETLLKEIHHRVKNNLQIISGLLELQESLHQDPGTHKIIEEAQSRIKSMAITHEMLYQNADLSAIDFQEYVVRLVDSVEKSSSGQELSIQKVINIKNVSFSIDTIIPIGLILNELLTNSYKYAFKKDRANKLFISIEKKENIWVLSCGDNGMGLPEQVSNVLKQKTFGLRLVGMLLRQLKGSYTYTFENGAFFVLSFKEATPHFHD